MEGIGGNQGRGGAMITGRDTRGCVAGHSTSARVPAKMRVGSTRQDTGFNA